ncbi:MAG: oxygenase MpaB family protein [Steroidobacteraceae bacterium]
MPKPVAPLSLPPLLQRQLEASAAQMLRPPGVPVIDFAAPRGEPALVPPDSISWRVFRNPVALFVGGVTAVLLELAEPRVRTGVWEHTSFRTAPGERLQRTGLAAMVTVYGARSVAERMIAGVTRLHGQVQGCTPSGAAYSASDPDLLTWVHATAAFGFVTAYSRYVRPLSRTELDRYYAEGQAAAALYGADAPPLSAGAMDALFERVRPALQPSPIVQEFLSIMTHEPVLPTLARPLQALLVRAAVDVAPSWLRERLGLDPRAGLGAIGRAVVPRLGALADRLLLRGSPSVQACVRLGLPEDYLLSP